MFNVVRKINSSYKITLNSFVRFYKKIYNNKMKENEIRVNAPWGKIAGIAFGDPSNPPVLVVHGKLDVCTGYRPLLRLLPTCFYYVAIDLPGNGRSDHLPRGVRFTVLDLVPSVLYVKEHFGWKNFMYIGHSLGALIGKLYNIAYPGDITRVVELDPVPAHHTWETSRDAMRSWYLSYYGSYSQDRYPKLHGPPETAPRYSYEKAEEMVMKTRQMTKEAATHVLERCLAPAENGLYRFTYDQRMKEVTVLPFSGDLHRRIYTATTTPTLAVIARGELERGHYDHCEFVTDRAAWPNGNYECVVVEGGHDVHIYNPECLARDVAKFLLQNKAKL